MTALLDRTTKKLGVYKQLEIACLPLIEAYHDDLLKHDREMITDNEGVPFLHYTRSCGTHLFLMHGSDNLPKKGDRIPFLFGTADRYQIAKGVVDCAASCVRDGNIHNLVHYFDGTRLKRLDGTKEALDVAEEYFRRLRREWSNEH